MCNFGGKVSMTIERKWRVVVRLGLAGFVAVMVVMAVVRFGVQAADVQSAGAKDLVQKMIGVENAEALRKGRFEYVSKERSERTGGQLWTERVVETSAGKVRRLMAEDGQPLTAEQAATEKAKLDGIAADPEGFRKRSQAVKDDEQHAKDMFGLLAKAFVFEGMRQDGEFIRIEFKPDPSYDPQSMEERVLHGMVGTVWIDPKSSRLHRLEGRLPADVSIGFGLIATVKAGSNFSTQREPVPGNEWKTALMDTDINGRAIFFKSIGKKEHAEHTDFAQVPMDVTVAQAVAMLEK
jgi:hypothetical protein